jgi:hypothetical protein
MRFASRVLPAHVLRLLKALRHHVLRLLKEEASPGDSNSKFKNWNLNLPCERPLRSIDRSNCNGNHGAVIMPHGHPLGAPVHLYRLCLHDRVLLLHRECHSGVSCWATTDQITMNTPCEHRCLLQPAHEAVAAGPLVRPCCCVHPLLGSSLSPCPELWGKRCV